MQGKLNSKGRIFRLYVINFDQEISNRAENSIQCWKSEHPRIHYTEYRYILNILIVKCYRK